MSNEPQQETYTITKGSEVPNFWLAMAHDQDGKQIPTMVCQLTKEPTGRVVAGFPRVLPQRKPTVQFISITRLDNEGKVVRQTIELDKPRDLQEGWLLKVGLRMVDQKQQLFKVEYAGVFREVFDPFDAMDERAAQVAEKLGKLCWEEEQ